MNSYLRTPSLSTKPTRQPIPPPPPQPPPGQMISLPSSTSHKKPSGVSLPIENNFRTKSHSYLNQNSRLIQRSIIPPTSANPAAHEKSKGYLNQKGESQSIIYAYLARMILNIIKRCCVSEFKVNSIEPRFRLQYGRNGLTNLPSLIRNGSSESKFTRKTEEESKYISSLQRLDSQNGEANTTNRNHLRTSDHSRNFPNLNCKAWGIFEEEDCSVIHGENIYEVREMASITKVMTCLVALKLVKRFSLNSSDFYFIVTRAATCVNGTMANIVENCWYSIDDLLYAMMLPSGNDAAICLAENFGCLLYFASNGQASTFSSIKRVDVRDDEFSAEYMRLFIREMNRVSNAIGLKQSVFTNVHGLPNKMNKSSCADLAKLTKTALKWAKFRQVVNTKVYKVTYREDDTDTPKFGVQMWKNTNKLLEQPGYSGVKTGLTPTAGSCLVSHFQTNLANSNNYISVIVIVLGGTNPDDRFDDTQKIIGWHLENQS